MALVLLALSKLALNTSFKPRASVTDLICRANLRQCSSDSTTFGPAMMKNGLEAFSSLKKLDSYRGDKMAVKGGEALLIGKQGDAQTVCLITSSVTCIAAV